jgi:hypothetical protein
MDGTRLIQLFRWLTNGTRLQFLWSGGEPISGGRRRLPAGRMTTSPEGNNWGAASTSASDGVQDEVGDLAVPKVLRPTLHIPRIHMVDIFRCINYSTC